MLRTRKRLRKTALLCGMTALFATSTAFAKYPLTYSATDPIMDSVTGTQITSDYFSVTITEPTMDTGDTLDAYVYLWSRPSTVDPELTDENCKASAFTTPCGKLTTNIISLSKENFESDDAASPDEYGWYLYVRALYHGQDQVPTYGDLSKLGPFNIDNVTTGSITIVDATGTQEITTTTSQTINVRVTYPTDHATQDFVCLSDIPGQQGTCFDSIPDNNIVSYTLSSSTPGDYTIYATFTDQAGNSAISTDGITLASAAISPETASLDVGSTQIFSIDGSSAGYDWSIKTQSPDNTGDTVCQLTSTTTTNTTSVALEALNPGTCVLQAALTTDNTQVLETGTITVKSLSTTVSIPLKTGWNLISIPLMPADTSPATVLAGIAGKYTIVWGEFDPSSGQWKSYSPDSLVNTLTAIKPNRGYWIDMTADATLNVTGTDATQTIDLKTGWNLIGFAVKMAHDVQTVLSGITGQYSILWGGYDPTTGKWKSYSPDSLVNTITTVDPGHGYWINMNQTTTLNY